VLPLEGGYLPGAGLDHTARQELAAGNGLADLVPFLRGALGGADGPDREHSGGQIGAPLRRPQRSPGLFLGHPDNPVIDPDAPGRRGGPAETPQRHPGVRRQPAAPGILPGSQDIHVRGVPVGGQQLTGHARHQISAPAHTLSQHAGGQKLAGLLINSGTDHGTGAGGAGGLAPGEPGFPAHLARSPLVHWPVPASSRLPPCAALMPHNPPAKAVTREMKSPGSSSAAGPPRGAALRG
jgi:hypothetical protein